MLGRLALPVATATLLLGTLGVGTAEQKGSSAPTMSAVRIHAVGGRDVLRYESVERPSPGPGEVLVRVHAAGVNPVDWKIRSGRIPGLAGRMPLILGYDVSGVVESAGPGVESWKPGDEVYAYLSLSRGGGYAEYAIALEDELAARPATIDHIHAAGVPLAALTAWQALVESADLRRGQSVLVHAGAGGVGHFAVQIARLRGAKVYATASPRNHTFLRDLGTDVAIDYRTQRFEEVATAVDVVLDSIGGETLERSYGIVKPGGIVVSIVARPAPDRLEQHGIRGASILVRPDGAQLAEIAALIDAGKIRPHVSEVFALADVARAHGMSEGGHTRGKLVLQTSGE